MASFLTVLLVPMALSALIAVPAFSDAQRAEAEKALKKNASVAGQLLSEQLTERRAQVSALAVSTFSDPLRRAPEYLPDELKRQGDLMGVDYLLWVTPEGIVTGSTTGHVGHTLAWPDVANALRAKDATSFLSIVPPVELSALGLSDALDVPLKETEGGSAERTEVVGALSRVAVARVTEPGGAFVGTLVAVDSLKKDSEFVDSVVAKVDGNATIFQNGVRVATTVIGPDGQRAVGTAVSDKVRKASLEANKPFRGEAFVVSEEYLAAYDPLRSPAGDPIGLLFVGVSLEPYNAAALRFALNFGIAVALGLAMAIFFAFMASKGIVRPLESMNAAAAQVASGDLTVTVPHSGYPEVAATSESFNIMTSSLRTLISNVGGSSGRLGHVSSEIASASRQEADTAANQASAVAEATATIEELSRSFGAVAEGARHVLDIAEDSLEAAETGRDTVESGSDSAEKLANGALAVNMAADELRGTAEGIGELTSIISGIAEQTKILALNAAIEAARAGEAGRGFGVVSTEIRALADSVGRSASRITALVRALQGSSKTLSSTALEQAGLAQESAASALHSRDTFEGIVDQMAQTAAAAREIASAAAQQKSATAQIVQAMHQLSQGTREAAAGSEQLASSAQQVQREANSLGQGLKGFRTS